MYIHVYITTMSVPPLLVGGLETGTMARHDLDGHQMALVYIYIYIYIYIYLNTYKIY